MKFKLKQYIVAVGVATLLLPGCNDSFMERYPLDQITDESFWKTETDLKLMLNSFYPLYIIGHRDGWADQKMYPMSVVGSPLMYGDSYSDNCVRTGNEWSSLGGKFVVPTGADESSGWYWWNLRKVNFFLQRYRQADLSEEKLNAYGGEAYFFKAWEYYKKAREIKRGLDLSRQVKVFPANGKEQWNKLMGRMKAIHDQKEGLQEKIDAYTPKTKEQIIPWVGLEGELEQLYVEPTAASFQGAAYRPDGTVGGDWYQSQYRYEDYVCTLLSTEEGAAPAELYWSRDMTLPGGDGTSVDSSVSQAQERLDALLSALEGAGSSGAGSGGTVQQGDVERLLGLMLTADSGQELVDALTDYYVYGQMLTALEGSQPLLQQNLAEAQTQLSRGSGTQTAVDSAKSELDSLDRRLAQYETAREQALLTIQELCKLSPDDYDLAAVLLTFDPVELDAAALYEAARLYAVSVAAGRYEVDTDALQRQITSAVLDLSMAYESIRSAQTEVEQAAADVEAQTQAYARGTADKASLYAAQCAQNEAVAALYQAVGEFTRQANALNTLSGGWIAGEYDWMADTFAALFQSEILRGEAAAQEAEEDRAQREEEAAQAIQEEAQATASPAPSAAPAPEETPAAGEAADDSYTLVGGA